MSEALKKLVDLCLKRKNGHHSSLLRRPDDEEYRENPADFRIARVADPFEDFARDADGSGR
jgi:hypothetical protein